MTLIGDPSELAVVSTYLKPLDAAGRLIGRLPQGYTDRRPAVVARAVLTALVGLALLLVGIGAAEAAAKELSARLTSPVYAYDGAAPVVRGTSTIPSLPSELVAPVRRGSVTAEAASVRSWDFGVAAETAGGGERLLWTSWQNYPKVAQGGREYAQIGDRLYTQHAVDRMQPSGLGAPAGATSPGRSISPNIVEDVLGNSEGVPVKGPNGEPRLSFTSGSVQVITEDGIVVTVITR